MLQLRRVFEGGARTDSLGGPPRGRERESRSTRGPEGGRDRRRSRERGGGGLLSGGQRRRPERAGDRRGHDPRDAAAGEAGGREGGRAERGVPRRSDRGPAARRFERGRRAEQLRD